MLHGGRNCLAVVFPVESPYLHSANPRGFGKLVSDVTRRLCRLGRQYVFIYDFLKFSAKHFLPAPQLAEFKNVLWDGEILVHWSTQQ